MVKHSRFAKTAKVFPLERFDVYSMYTYIVSMQVLNLQNSQISTLCNSNALDHITSRRSLRICDLPLLHIRSRYSCYSSELLNLRIFFTVVYPQTVSRARLYTV